MCLGFQSLANYKLQKFPSSVIKPLIVNQDCVENHFCQARSCNGKNDNPTFLQQQSSQNSIRLGQTTISPKSNASCNSNCTHQRPSFPSTKIKIHELTSEGNNQRDTITIMHTRDRQLASIKENNRTVTLTRQNFPAAERRSALFISRQSIFLFAFCLQKSEIKDMQFQQEEGVEEVSQTLYYEFYCTLFCCFFG